VVALPDSWANSAVQDASPTLSRLMLGQALRTLREKTGISRDAACRAIRATESKISRLELGRAGIKLRDVADLCALYGVTDHLQRATLLGMARLANGPEWWHSYREVIPRWFEPYLGLEQAASLIRSYETQFVPGLLQTPAYARVLLSNGASAQAVIERRIELRLRRQHILQRYQPTQLWALIDEAALRRQVGGRATMSAQLHHLLDVCHMSNVTIQVLTLRGGGPMAESTFTMLRLPEREIPDLVYMEQLATAMYLHHDRDSSYYLHTMNLLTMAAEPVSATPGILHRILNDV
jgi:transcriptional regulator with XRE-family HTH domain